MGTPFGVPVVPEVKTTKRSESGDAVSGSRTGSSPWARMLSTASSLIPSATAAYSSRSCDSLGSRRAAAPIVLQTVAFRSRGHLGSRGT